MLSPGILYTAAALMALVATICTALCLVWSVPAWRRWLARAGPNVRRSSAAGLTGCPAHIGSWLVAVGIAACALLAWYGVYCTLLAV